MQVCQGRRTVNQHPTPDERTDAAQDDPQLIDAERCSRGSHALRVAQRIIPLKDSPRNLALSEQCVEMLDQWRAHVPHSWVTGDDELGRHTQFRQELRERGERYVLGVPCNTTMRDLEALLPEYPGRGRRPKAPWQ